MRVFHKDCGNSVEITTERIAVRILEVLVTDDDCMKESLLDLVSLRSGKITVFCPKCKATLDPKTDLVMPCIRCGEIVPTHTCYTLRPEWVYVCKKCFGMIWNAYHKGSDIPDEPTCLKLK